MVQRVYSYLLVNVVRCSYGYHVNCRVGKKLLAAGINLDAVLSRKLALLFVNVVDSGKVAHVACEQVLYMESRAHSAISDYGSILFHIQLQSPRP